MSTETRESRMVVVERDTAGTPTVWCDPEIVDLVTALNRGGVQTVASCSGHGVNVGNIALRDGRELLIAPNFEAAREMEAALSNPPTAIPDGMVVVPRTMTNKMAMAVVEQFDCAGSSPMDVWRALIAAAPGSAEGGGNG